MCGIIGIVGKEEVAERLVDGLRRMEYRGYDSAGVCTIHGGQLIRRRAPGKLVGLVKELARDPAPGTTGIAHTRWATHGAPTAANAHPHATKELALVHNGIIENFRQLKEALQARGHKFESDTDTEVVAHLISEQVEAGKTPADVDDWLSKAEEVKGSWWPLWMEWVQKRSGKKKPAPEALGNETYAAGDAAPGLYVVEEV